jgi:sulfite reductase alpha subunit-like flavoprotein
MVYRTALKFMTSSTLGLASLHNREIQPRKLPQPPASELFNADAASGQVHTQHVALLLAVACRLLTADWSDRTVVHVELELADSGMRFTAGDAVGVLPSNDPALVAALLSRLGVDGDDVFEVEPASGELQLSD